MVISFGIIGSLPAINFIAFWGVAPCNFVEYMSVVGENVTWAACNSVMYFDLYAFPLWFGDCESRVLQIGRSLVQSQMSSVDFLLTWKTSDRTVTVGTTLPLTEMITGNISCWWRRTSVWLTTYQHPAQLSLNLGPLTSWNFLGLTRPVMGRL